MEFYEHQKEGIDFLETSKYAILGDEQGLGKTMQAIMAVKDIEGLKVVVCPAFLRGTWAAEIEKFLGKKSKVILKGTDEVPRGGWCIISYDFIRKLELNPIVVIFDECHYLKNMEAKRTVHAHNLVLTKKPSFCFLLSGTPIKNDVTEFYSLLKLMSYCPTDTNGERIRENSQYAFSIKFSVPSTRTIYTPQGREVQITEFKGTRNVVQLRNYLKGKYLRRLAKDVLNLPEIVDREIFLDKIPKGLARDFEKCFMAHEKGFNKDEHFSTVKKDFALKKVKASITLADDLIHEGEQVIIFSDHVQPAQEIALGLMNKGWTASIITGDVDHIERDEIVEKFQAGKIDVIVATIGAASTGFTLTAARNMIFNDVPWSYVDLVQARKRIHRVGQNRHCVVSYILAGEVDQRILKKIRLKAKNLKEVL